MLETDQEEGPASMSTNRQSSPKYTIVEKWILDRQKRKVLAEHNWAQKQQKTSQKITACSDRLKVCIYYWTFKAMFGILIVVVNH